MAQRGFLASVVLVASAWMSQAITAPGMSTAHRGQAILVAPMLSAAPGLRSTERLLRLRGGTEENKSAQVEREQLRAQMQECVRNEQYAEAALLQEQLKALAAEAEAAKPAEPATEMAAEAAAEPEVEAAVPGVKGKELPTMNIADIAKFNNWDHRECAVANKDEWKDYMDRFLQENPGIGTKIPKKIHQIWIGPKQPPIVWIDTWRKKYRSEYPGWDYTLWTDKEVAELPLRMKNLYDKEKMYQCKADLLRLEVLWMEGGVYIDADMVWLHKDLQDVLDASKDTGFFCGYEPDTKDKPYSVIGNSFIAATPKHPLVDMLIKYIQCIYDHKRPYHGVEWVTGPLAYTKCISHTKMPWTVPPQVWFYPKFHYVPNPDAINMNDFPNSYAFQFGYTCSGLEGWVANAIRRATLDNFWLDKCPSLATLQWPLGKLIKMPDDAAGPQGAPIPKIIHQFAFQNGKPQRWMDSWAQAFCQQNPGWTYKCWTTMEELKGDYFCCNLYSDQAWQMEEPAMKLLALEVLYKHGGYHVPLAIPYDKQGGFNTLVAGAVKSQSMDSALPGSVFSEEAIASGFVEAPGLGIYGAAPGATGCLQKIKDLVALKASPSVPKFIGYPDSVSSYLDFPDWTRFLGASEFYDLTGSPAAERAMLSWSYDSVVPAYRVTRETRNMMRTSEKRFIAITDPEILYYKALADAIPGFIQQMDNTHGRENWHFIVLMLQWGQGTDETNLYQVHSGGVPPESKFVGFVANDGAGKRLDEMQPDLSEHDLVQSVLNKHSSFKVAVGAEKFACDRELAQIRRAIPSVLHAFQALAQHVPPLDHDREERHGNTIKAMHGDQVRYELQVDSEHRAAFRAFNDDGAINCEARVQDGHNGKKVDYIKVFYNHQLVFEKQNQFC